MNTEGSMGELKTLANCKPSEFLKQANKIRKSVAKWLTDTNILTIRKNLPDLEKITDDMDDAKKVLVAAKNKELLQAQARENAMEILDAVMDEYPDELLALLCFVEPEHVDDHTVVEYLNAFTELIEDEAVVGFFSSLARLGKTNLQTQ